MVAQQCEYTQCHWTVHLKKVKVVDYMCILLQLLKITIFKKTMT